MVALPRVHLLPQLHRVATQRGGGLTGEYLGEAFAGGLDGLTAATGTVGPPCGLEARGLDALEVGGKLPLSGPDLSTGVRDLPGVALTATTQTAKLRQRDALDVLVKEPCGDPSGRRAPTGAVAGVAHVDHRLGRAATHDVPAAGAACEARQQRRGALGACRSQHTGALCGVPGVSVHDGRVGVRVGVLADVKLAEIDPVVQQRPSPGWRHAEVAGDSRDGQTAGALGERAPHLPSVSVGHQSTGRRVTAVAQRCLSALPDTRPSRSLAEVSEAFAVLVEFVFVDGCEHGAGHPAGGGAGVDVLRDGHDRAAGCFDAVPHREQVTGGPPSPGEVGDDEAPVASGLDTFDGLGEDGPVGTAARLVEFGLEDGDGLASGLGPCFDGGALVTGGAEALTGPSADMGHPHIPDPGRHGGESICLAQPVPLGEMDSTLPTRIEGMGRFWLYRLFDSAGDLLYVGITECGEERFKQHSKDKEWWHEVSRRTVTLYATREACANGEAWAIATERPRYNIIGVSSGRQVSAAEHRRRRIAWLERCDPKAWRLISCERGKHGRWNVHLEHAALEQDIVHENCLEEGRDEAIAEARQEAEWTARELIVEELMKVRGPSVVTFVPRPADPEPEPEPIAA